MHNLISRQAAIDTLTEYGNGRAVYISVEEAVRRIEQLSSAQPEILACGEGELITPPERIIFDAMTDEEFEDWLHWHGICNPCIYDAIPCDIVPLLIDSAINELLFSQPEVVRCENCKHFNHYFVECDSNFGLPYANVGDFCSKAEKKNNE